MSLLILDELEQGTPEWHDQRRGIVTASVVGQLLTPTLGVAENDKSRGLTAVLVAERICGWTEDNYVSNDMWRGINSEPIARDIYGQHYAKAEEVGFMVRREDDWTLGYSPDGVVGHGGLIEIKSPRAKTHLNTILSGEVPAHYMAQCQSGLLVSGRRWIDFVSYCGGMPLWVKRVYPDPAWQTALIAACKRFEETAAQIQAAYLANTTDLPATERLSLDNLGLVF